MDETLRKEMERGETKKKRTSRGSKNNARRLDAFRNRGGRGDAEWATCDAHMLLAVVDKITALGGAITLSLSRDMGAHGLTLLMDDDRESLWFNGDADLTEELRAVLVALEQSE